LTVLDAPSQRFYAIGLYAVLFLWKLYDWVSVAEEGEGSWGMFLKWIVIDIIYLFGLPELRIPWLEWSQTFVTGVYCAHVVIDWLLMFLVPVSADPGRYTGAELFQS
jgi:nucleoporin POM152